MIKTGFTYLINQPEGSRPAVKRQAKGGRTLGHRSDWTAGRAQKGGEPG